MRLHLQAFNITSDKTETLDNMLTDLLSSNMPVGGLQLFGIKQMEMKNMSTCEYSKSFDVRSFYSNLLSLNTKIMT